MYVLGVFIAFIVVMAIMWFIMTQIMGVIQLEGRQLAIEFNSYNDQFIGADTFITYLFMFFLLIALLGFAYWAWIYTQYKGSVIGG